MNGIQCKEELDLEKNINNLPKMVKKSKSKIPKSKRICLCVHSYTGGGKIPKFSIFSQVSHSYESRVKMGKGIGKIR